MNKAFTEREQEFLEELWRSNFFDIKIDRRGNIEIDYDINYLDEDFVQEFSDCLTCIDDFVELLSRIKLYTDDRIDYIQLSDNHTLYEIQNTELDEYQYGEAVDRYCDEFVEITGVDVYLLGRMGRHVCVEFTIDNIINYDYLKEVQADLESQMIAELSEE